MPNANPEKILETDRLLLRPWQDSDLEPFAALNQDPEVMEFFPKRLSRQESDELVSQIQSRFLKYGYCFWAVELKATGEFIGFLGLNVPGFEAHFTPCVEIGWRLAREHWGKGLATEGARKVLEFAFGELGLTEVVAFTVPANRRSRAVMQRLGMQRDPEEDFEHPQVEAGHQLSRHVLYRIRSLPKLS